MLNHVDHVVACDRINTQPRKLGVDGEVERRRTGIAVRVGDAGRYGQIAVAQRGQLALG